MWKPITVLLLVMVQSCIGFLYPGFPCSSDNQCRSGPCVQQICTVACQKTAGCGPNSYCHKKQYCRPTRGLGEACSADKHCKTHSCVDSKCVNPHGSSDPPADVVWKQVGESCNAADNTHCSLGAVCEDGLCRALGSNLFFRAVSLIASTPPEILGQGLRKLSPIDQTEDIRKLLHQMGLDKQKVVLDAKCSYQQELDEGLFTCSEEHAYCDYDAGICRAKQDLGAPCRWTDTRGREVREVDSHRRCTSDRCIHGRCAPEQRGQANEPCVRDDECKVAGHVCRTTYIKNYGGLKMCNPPVESGSGQRCKQSSDCSDSRTYCYQGECHDSWEIDGKACKTADDCGGGLRRVEGEITYTKLGFRCEQEKCKYYECTDGSAGFSGLVGNVVGDDNRRCPPGL